VGVSISVEHLNAWYGTTHTLQDINVNLPANHATALIGPSGCGKSTFVRCLNRMHETNPIARATGVVKMGDIDIYKDAQPVQIRRRVGMVFQRPNPFPTMSIYDNVASGLKLNGFRNRAVLDETVERSLKSAALWEEVKDDLKKKSGASLSGGQQQRMCIARALAVDPEVLLMDEPASALDPVSTSKIEDLIFQLKSQYTIVIVTHNMQQAARVAENTGFFLNGKMVEFDSTHKIFTPRTSGPKTTSPGDSGSAVSPVPVVRSGSMGAVLVEKERRKRLDSQRTVSRRSGCDGNTHQVPAESRRLEGAPADHGRDGGAGDPAVDRGVPHARPIDLRGGVPV
jgi:phosphate transport system ATP-binding protein